MMKKTLFIALLTFSFLNTYGQYDPDALAVLDAMSEKYKQVDAFKASFTQKLTNKEAGLDESISGEITVKGSKFVLDVAGQKIFNNGVDVYSYNEEFQEVSISTYEAEDAELNLGNIYDIYKSGFKYTLLSEMQNGVRVVELDPESREKSYFKIRMNIDAKDALKSFTVFERTNNIYTYLIDEFEEVTVNDSFFTFDTTKYPDVEVIDFR
jgi:outer membrane lipoprotein-sorting protein